MTTNIEQARRALDAHRELSTALAELNPAGRVLSFYGFLYRHGSSISIVLELEDDARRLGEALALELEDNGADTPQWYGKAAEVFVTVQWSGIQATEQDTHDAELDALGADLDGRLEPAGGVR